MSAKRPARLVTFAEIWCSMSLQHLHTPSGIPTIQEVSWTHKIEFGLLGEIVNWTYGSPSKIMQSNSYGPLENATQNGFHEPLANANAAQNDFLEPPENANAAHLLILYSYTISPPLFSYLATPLPLEAPSLLSRA